MMQITLRSARPEDFEYCKRLYFAGMRAIIEELNLNMAAQVSGFSQQWTLAEVRIISSNGSDMGWLQSTTRDDSVFVAQLFVDTAFQRQGIGTEVMKRLIAEAARVNQAVSLTVAKINPAVRLYKRLGFHIIGEDDRKFYMRREPDRKER